MNNITTNTQTHLFICFIEEINELIEAIFNEDKEEINDEYHDFLGTLEVLNQELNIVFDKTCSVPDVNIIQSLLLMQKMSFKAIRFGFDDSYPGKTQTNFDLISTYVNVFKEKINMIYNFKINETKVLAKRNKIMKFLDYSKDRGIVND